MDRRPLLALCLLFCVAAGGEDLKIPGLDTSKMTGGEKKNLRDLAEKLPSPCGKPHSLMKSLTSDPSCRRSQAAIHAIQDWLMNGFLPSEAEEKYEQRYPRKPADIDTAGAYVRGDPKAPITIVEFSDFECPHCKLAEPVIKQILQEFPQAKLVFMNFPLSMHQYAAGSAAAAVAAGKQGKFWAYHDKLFEHQDKQTPVDLQRYAQELGLNLQRWQVDMEAAKVRVAKERAIGEKLELSGTPTFFIDGRRFVDSPTVEAMRPWIEEDLKK